MLPLETQFPLLVITHHSKLNMSRNNYQQNRGKKCIVIFKAKANGIKAKATQNFKYQVRLRHGPKTDLPGKIFIIKKTISVIG